jgi:hypothetical protein
MSLLDVPFYAASKGAPTELRLSTRAAYGFKPTDYLIAQCACSTAVAATRRYPVVWLLRNPSTHMS